MRRSTVMIVIAVLLVVSSIALGAVNVQKIEAYLANDMSFRMDGQAWRPADTDGTPLTPIIYRSRSYVPVRALLEEKGVAVNFDDATRTIILDYPEYVIPLTGGKETTVHKGTTIEAKTITAVAGKSTPKLFEAMVSETTVSLTDNASIYLDNKELTQSLTELALTRRKFNTDKAKLYLNEKGEVFRVDLTGDNSGDHVAGKTSVEVEASCCPLKIKITIKF